MLGRGLGFACLVPAPPHPASSILKKGRGQRTGRQPRPSYFKLPAECDDEESLEERRGRTVLRTAM